jgi:hypothetical protein
MNLSLLLALRNFATGHEVAQQQQQGQKKKTNLTLMPANGRWDFNSAFM